MSHQHSKQKSCGHPMDEDDYPGHCQECVIANLFASREQEINSLCKLMTENGLQWLMWEFHAAPSCLADFSPHGGDEDWLFLTRTPDDRRDRYVDILESGGLTPSVTRLPNGYEIWIRAHA